ARHVRRCNFRTDGPDSRALSPLTLEPTTMSHPVRRSAAALAVLLAAGLLTACSDDSPAECDCPAQAAPPAAARPHGPAPHPPLDADGAAAAATVTALEHPDPGDAVAAHTYDLVSPEGASATVAVHPLRVDGQVMVLQLSFTPDFSGDERLTVFDMNQDRTFAPVLNDRENLKQYSVVTDDMGTILATDATGLGPSVRSGETLTYWAYFAAPEDDI